MKKIYSWMSSTCSTLYLISDSYKKYLVLSTEKTRRSSFSYTGKSCNFSIPNSSKSAPKLYKTTQFHKAEHRKGTKVSLGKQLPNPTTGRKSLETFRTNTLRYFKIKLDFNRWKFQTLQENCHIVRAQY